MIYHLVYWLLQAELGTVLLLMLFSFLPGFIRRPVRGLITGLSIPFMRQILISVGVGLAALLAESIRTASEHSFKKHDFDGTVKDKMHHDLKRLRAERNSYIAFGCLFSFLVICQIWALMKKMIDLVGCLFLSAGISSSIGKVQRIGKQMGVGASCHIRIRAAVDG